MKRNVEPVLEALDVQAQGGTETLLGNYYDLTKEELQVEIAKFEVEVLEKTADEARQVAIEELYDSELALVGGGNGTVIFG